MHILLAVVGQLIFRTKFFKYLKLLDDAFVMLLNLNCIFTVNAKSHNIFQKESLEYLWEINSLTTHTTPLTCVGLYILICVVTNVYVYNFMTLPSHP